MNTQKNSQNRKALAYFELVNEAEHIFSCKIDGCGKQTKAKNIGNLVSHIKHVHTTLYFEKINAVANEAKSIKLKRLDLLQACAEIVTVNGRPFKYLTDSGFQLAIRDKLRELEENGQGFSVTQNDFEEVKNYIKLSGEKILDIIRDEAQDKLVSVMTDIGSKNERSVLGTHIRYVAHNKVITRNIGMTLISDRHRSAVLKDIIVDQLSKISVEPSQLIAFTSDNARNMVATARLLDTVVASNTTIAQNDSEDEEEYGMENEGEGNGRRATQWDSTQYSSYGNISIAEVEAMIQDTEQRDGIDENLQSILDDDNIDEESERNLESEFAGQTLNIHRVPCSAHTLQLAMKDFFDAVNVKTLISLSRLVAIELRKSASLYDLKAENIHIRKIRIDCPTRWSSIHRMVDKNLFRI